MANEEPDWMIKAEKARRDEEARLKAFEEAWKEEEARFKAEEEAEVARTRIPLRMARTMTNKQLVQAKATAEERVQASRARANTAMTEAQRAEEAWLKAVEEMQAWAKELKAVEEMDQQALAMAPEEAGKDKVRQVKFGYEARMQAAEEARLRASEAKKRAEEAMATDSAEQSYLKAATQAEAIVAEAKTRAGIAAEAASFLQEEIMQLENAIMQAGGAGKASSVCKRRGNTNPHAQEEARASMVEGEKAEGRAAKRRHGGRNEGGGGIGRAVEQANAEGQD